MSKKAETNLKDRVRKKFKLLPNTWFEKINQVSVRGIPDIIMCVNGHFVGIELKRDDGEAPASLQRYKLKNIKKSGGITFVLTPENFEEAYQFLFNLASQRRPQ